MYSIKQDGREVATADNAADVLRLAANAEEACNGCQITVEKDGQQVSPFTIFIEAL